MYMFGDSFSFFLFFWDNYIWQTFVIIRVAESIFFATLAEDCLGDVTANHKTMMSFRVMQTII